MVRNLRFQAWEGSQRKTITLWISSLHSCKIRHCAYGCRAHLLVLLQLWLLRIGTCGACCTRDELNRRIHAMRLHGAVVPQRIKWPFTVQSLISAESYCRISNISTHFSFYTVCKFQSLPKSNLHFSAERKNCKSWWNTFSMWTFIYCLKYSFQPRLIINGDHSFLFYFFKHLSKGKMLTAKCHSCHVCVLLHVLSIENTYIMSYIYIGLFHNYHGDWRLLKVKGGKECGLHIK